MKNDTFQVLLKFFKALGNENRLKIIGILANRPYTVGELAEMLNLKEPTVSEHLNMLKDAGLVSVEPDGNKRYYVFNPKMLQNMNRDVFSQAGLAALVDLEDEDERKLLQRFMEGGRLKQIPASRKKFDVLIKWLASKFEFDRDYAEQEVNAILKQYHEDYALLRRALVDQGYLDRARGIYWKVGKEKDKGPRAEFD